MNVRRTCFVLLLSLSLPVASACGQHLLGKDKIFIRFTNIRADGAMVLVRVNVVPNHHEPFGWQGKTVYVGKDGEGEEKGARYLLPGEQSPWVDIGQYMNKRGTRSWDTYLSPVLCGVMTSPQANGLHLVAEIAEGQGTSIIRRIQLHKKELPAQSKHRKYPWLLGHGTWNGSGPFLPTLGLLVPTQPDLLPRVYSLAEALKWQLDCIEEFPDTGRLPTKFIFKTRDQPPVKEALGYNGYPDDVIEGNLGDEISIQLKTPVDEQNRRFREHVKGLGLNVMDLIASDGLADARKLDAEKRWELVTLDPLPSRPKQFYHSANFRYQLWYEELAKRTKAIVEKHPDKRVLTGANFSPHMNVWPDVRQWVGPFRERAMTMTWTEDWWWQLPESSPQVYGWLLDGLRLAGSYHDLPLQFYVMPFRGQSQDNFRRMHGLALSHGAKILFHFVTQNQAMITWDYVDQIESPRTYQAIHDLMRQIGAVEHRLHPALPKKAKIAIMLSRAADTWDTEDLGGAGHLYGAKYNVNNDERKAIWMALRHAQYPVDLILDEDIGDGKLDDYQVLYVVGSEMLAKAAPALKDWVRQGGIVYATGGGGLLDEYRRPIKSLYEVYGLKGHELTRQTRHIRPRNDLPKTKPIDTVRVRLPDLAESDQTLPAMLYRETLTPDGGRVRGMFKRDEAVAIIENEFGKGRTLYVGTLAGIAYLTPAMTESSQVLPTEFPQPVRDLITLPAKWAKIVPPVVTSDPLVEAQYMVGENGAIVVLTNWRESPAEKMVIRFPGKPSVKRVQSLEAAGYFKGHLHQQKTGLLDVEVVDGVPQVTTELATIDFLLVD